MSTAITLSVPTHAKILVRAQDHVSDKTVLATAGESHHTETIHLAKLLGVPNLQIPKFMKKTIGEKVDAGDIIAEKKSLFSASRVRSPFAGKIASLDLSQGSADLLKYTKEGKRDFISPVNGKVSAVGKTFIEIEIQSPILKGTHGGGKDAVSDLKHLKGETVGVLGAHDEIADKIVVCRFIEEAALVKFSVIGVAGVVVAKMKGETVLPWISVEENIFEKLISYDKKRAWLRPGEKQIIILD